MTFFLKRESSAGNASPGRNSNKPSRRIAKDSISAPTLLPWSPSLSLPNPTTSLNNAVKTHKRGRSEPFPAGRAGWNALIGGRRSLGITKIILSGRSIAGDTSNDIFSHQTGAQSIQIIFPPCNRDKSLPPTPRLEHLSLMTDELPVVTFTSAGPRLAEFADRDVGELSRTIVCDGISQLVGRKNAERVAIERAAQKRQEEEQLQDEEAQDMYATTMSLFETTSLYHDRYLEPSNGEMSSICSRYTCEAGPRNTIRPRSIVLTIHGDGKYAGETAVDTKNETRRTHYVPPEGTSLAKMSKPLDARSIPYTSEEVEIFIPYKPKNLESRMSWISFKESDHASGAEKAGPENIISERDLSANTVLQIFREGSDAIHEELLAKEIIFARGSTYVYRRNTPELSKEGVFRLVQHRKAQLFPPSFPLEEDLPMFAFELTDEPNNTDDE